MHLRRLPATIPGCCPMEEIYMPAGLYDEMIRHLAAHYPEEACGLLGGRVDGRSAQSAQLYPVENALHSPVAYEMEPLAQVRAMLSIEAEGLELVGIFHSHPAGPAAPSPSDVAQAFYPDAAQIIVTLADRSRPAARAFMIRDGRVDEIRLSRGI